MEKYLHVTVSVEAARYERQQQMHVTWLSTLIWLHECCYCFLPFDLCFVLTSYINICLYVFVDLRRMFSYIFRKFILYEMFLLLLLLLL